MLLYIDYNNNYCFIVPPKCGNTSIAHNLKIDFNIHYTHEEMISVLTNDKFKKIIVLRNIYDRFLSGFYEDLNNNSCYKNINISFHEFCTFINHCHNNKIKNVTNVKIVFNHINRRIWWGGNALKLPITDENGNIYGHIASQNYNIKNIIHSIQGTNVIVIDMKDLSKYLKGDNTTIKNYKIYSKDVTMTYNTKLNKIKKNIAKGIGLNKEKLFNNYILSVIQNIYKEDLDMINNLYTKYKNFDMMPFIKLY